MNRLKELRKEKNLSAKELGELFNITDVTILRYENEKQNINANMLKKLSEFYNVSVDYILCLTDVKENIQLLKEEKQLLDNYRELDTKGKTIAQEQINTLKKLL